jgi:nucleotide-binding universal stress UspA family protein
MERRLKPGEEHAGFRVLDLMHEGGMALLYRVCRAEGGEPLVMKLPRLGFGDHPACYVGFETETMLLARLTGPHVPRLVARGETGEGPYLVIELIDGPELSDSFRRAPLPADEAARLMLPVAEAVHDLHRQDVIHFDLKPANVRFRPDGTAVLLDFGLARHGRLPDLAGEEFDRPLGTGAYIAPEQVLGLRSDPRSDLFALGVMLYELATGALPFGMPATPSGFRRRLWTDPLPPRRRRPGLPEWYQQITLRCLETEAGSRYATAAQLAYDLAHPEQVAIDERGRRLKRIGLRARLARWLRLQRAPPGPVAAPSEHLASAPHVLVALDTGAGEALGAALREAVARIVQARPDCLVTCITVFEPSALTQQEDGEEIARGMMTERFMALRHWARPLGLPDARLRYHVLEGTDAAARIAGYAAARHVDHIVIGARGSGSLRRFIGSVSARVAAEAPCTVTVVRPEAHREPPAGATKP